MSATPSEALRGAREFLADPDHWLRSGAYAEGSNGRSLNPEDDDFATAVKCCAYGACLRAGYDYQQSMSAGDPLSALLEAEAKRLGADTVIAFNDYEAADHGELLTLLDGAIAEAEAS